MSALHIVEAAEQAGYRMFAAALRRTALLKTLKRVGPFTVFAPTDDAFERLSAVKNDQLLKGEPELLALVMGYHIAAGQVGAARFAGKRIRAVMQAGGDVIIDGRDGLHVNAANIAESDISAANGVIHGVDAVLWPKQASVTVGAA